MDFRLDDHDHYRQTNRLYFVDLGTSVRGCRGSVVRADGKHTGQSGVSSLA
jgi:hypothetical protein